MSLDVRWSQEQQELGALLAGLLAKHSGSLVVRAAMGTATGIDAGLWRLLCDQVGVAALTVPEEHGGAGFGFAEAAVALERLGYALAPTPYLSVVLCVQALLDAGDGGAARLLPGIATGGTLPALAWAGVTGMPDHPLGVTAAGGRLTGQVPLVLDAAAADVLLVVADDGPASALFAVDPAADGVRRSALPAVDSTLRFAHVELAAVPAEQVGVLADDGAALHALGAAAVAATTVGVVQRALDMTVAYSKERVQFGRPIGSFQALKHRMAEMLVAVETSRSAALAAALAVAAGSPDAGRRSSVAKAWCADAATHVAAEMVQLHGGIAITWEHDAHLVFKRVHALGQLFGPPHRHRARLLPAGAEPG